MSLEGALAAIQQKDGRLAGSLINDELLKDPDNAAALHLLAQTLLEVNKPALARLAAIQATTNAPDKWETWFMLGASETALQRPPIALRYLDKALEMSPENPAILRVMASAAVAGYMFEKAENYADRSLAIEDHPQGHVAKAFGAFHRGDWVTGWEEYHHGLGHQDWRDKHDYGLPDWEGQDGKLLVYGEQGMGDQLAMCSTLDKSRISQLNINPKLQTLLQRAFPDTEVYGDMFKAPVTFIPKGDYQVNLAGYQRFTKFNRKPYLKPHYDKAVQWRGLLASTGFKPKVGIAWTGGIPGTAGFRTRNKTLEELLPLLKLPFTWISMEYRDQTEDINAFEATHGIKIYNWLWGTKTEEYDNTAALVSCLDSVVCVPTTIYHLCGGLGIPCDVLVHDEPYYYESPVHGDTSPWWECVNLYRGPDSIERVSNALRIRLSNRACKL